MGFPAVPNSRAGRGRLPFGLCFFSKRCSVADSNFVLGNAQVAGLFPVVYCSDGFCDLTGFSRAEVMQRGCACSFLYGPDTSELVRQQIRKALDEHKEFKAELILYRKSGKAPWHRGTSLPHAGQSNRPCTVSLPFSSQVPIHPPIPFSVCPYLSSWVSSSCWSQTPFTSVISAPPHFLSQVLT